MVYSEGVNALQEVQETYAMVQCIRLRLGSVRLRKVQVMNITYAKRCQALFLTFINASRRGLNLLLQCYGAWLPRGRLFDRAFLSL